MKVPPADFLSKHPRLVIAGALFLLSSTLNGQNYAPGAVQAPNYRQGGSAYPQASAGKQRYVSSQPTSSTTYRPGYGTPPAGYKPPPLNKKGSTSAPAKTTAKSKPASLETKVARLEKKEAQQDRRIHGLERGSPVSGTGHASSPSAGKTYVVRPGDTLWRIADKYSTSINALKAANRLPSEVITVGQTLVIPGYGPAAAPAETHLDGVHIVRPGDTFSQIAHANGISQDALARANPSAYPDRLLVGERLTIPGKKGSTSTSWTPPASSSTATASSRAHIVKRGESLGAIAKSYGIPTSTLASANKIKNPNLIEPGQRLIIPGGGSVRGGGPAPSYPSVESDTQPLPDARLYTYSTPAPELAPAPMAPVTPAPEPAPAAPKHVPVSSNSRGIVAYRLERGDDINTVANLFQTTPEKIRELNKLPANSKLKEGDEVVIPTIGAISLN